MKEQLLNVMERKQLVMMMYISQAGEITKRKVRVLGIKDKNFQAYCYTKHAKRTFIIENVLAMLPITYKRA